MANLKIFISSTCYDLAVVRSQLRNFLVTIGYEPVMSDYSDVLFDPRQHTHTSCVQEVTNCDVIILIIGARYGGSAVPKAIETVDIEKVKEMSSARKFALDSNDLSVTQLEILKAIELGIPIFTFIDAGVLHDHLTYEKNKHKDILNKIEFPHIEKQETATYIFEFINFLRLRGENNSTKEFAKLEDIEVHLRKQWAALFQRLLYEQKTKAIEEARIDFLTSQIADLKAAIMTSITSKDLKETAKGAIRFRLLVDLVFGLCSADDSTNIQDLLRANISWEEVLSRLHIVEIVSGHASSLHRRAILIKDDGTYYRTLISFNTVLNQVGRWEEFRHLNNDVKEAILNALVDISESRIGSVVRHVNEPYERTSSVLPDIEEDEESVKA